MSRVITPVFRVSFPKLLEAEKNPLSGRKEYSVVALFKKGEDLSELKNAVKNVIETKWPDPEKRPQKLRLPFREQGKLNKDGDMPLGHEKGAIYLNLKSLDKPAVLDEDCRHITEKSQIYAGCWAKASVSVYPYDKAGNTGVAFGLGNVQKIRDDEPFKGAKAEDEFTPVKREDNVGNNYDDILF